MLQFYNPIQGAIILAWPRDDIKSRTLLFLGNYAVKDDMCTNITQLQATQQQLTLPFWNFCLQGSTISAHKFQDAEKSIDD